MNIKKLLLALVVALSGTMAYAQSTVTGTVADANGNAYFPGTVSAAIVLNSGQALPAGVPASGSIGPNPTTSGGNFSVIVPSPFTWIFTICSTPTNIGPRGNTTPSQVCFSTAPLAIVSSQNITSSLPAIPLLGPSTTGGAGALPSGGSVGQVIVNTAPGAGTWQDPNVSFTPVNLFSSANATATRTSANVKNPVYSATGTLMVTWASITGSPSGCTIQMVSVDSLGNQVNSGAAVAVSPANGTSSIQVPKDVSGTVAPAAPQIAAIYACSVYPSGGSLSLDFVGQMNGPGQGTGATSIGQWVQPGQALIAQLTAMNGTAVTAVDLIVDAKILLQNGQIQLTRYEINPCNFQGNIAMSGFAITQGGWLQTFVEDINTGGIPQGDVLLNLYIANSIGAADTATCHTSLAASQIGTSLGTWMTGSFLPTGFIGTTGNITHPWSIPGLQAVKTQANPALGNDFSFQLSGPATNGRACITGVNFFLTANATVATRTVALRIVQLANGLGSVGLQPDMFFISPVDQTAGQLVFYSFAPAVIPQQRTMFGNGGDIPFVTIPFASGQICADAGMIISIASRIHGLQAGDQISGVYVWVTQWHDND